MTLIALSASYGAGGSIVGPRVAERLDVPFVDRAIPAAVAEELDVPLAEALERDESVGSALERVLKHFAPLSATYASAPTNEAMLGGDLYREATERVICERAREGRGVILGRACAVVLRDRPGVLRVRLDGPAERRIEQAMRVEGIDRETAKERLRRTDRARDAYMRHFYGAGPQDPGLFDLTIDSTAVGLDTCVELIVLAAQARSA
jgi:cytidylate kinase